MSEESTLFERNHHHLKYGSFKHTVCPEYRGKNRRLHDLQHSQEQFMAIGEFLGYDRAVGTLCWEKWWCRNKPSAILSQCRVHRPETKSQEAGGWIFLIFYTAQIVLQSSVHFEDMHFVFQTKQVFIILCICTCLHFLAASLALALNGEKCWGVKLGVTWSALYSSLLSADPFLMGFPNPCSVVVGAFLCGKRVWSSLTERVWF